jgi:hypothetical protein
MSCDRYMDMASSLQHIRMDNKLFTFYNNTPDGDGRSRTMFNLMDKYLGRDRVYLDYHDHLKRDRFTDSINGDLHEKFR